MKLKAIEPIKSGGERYEPGEELEVKNEKAAHRLLDLGVAEKPQSSGQQKQAKQQAKQDG